MSSVWDFILLLMDVFSAVGLEAQSHSLSSACSGPGGPREGVGAQCPHALLDGGEPALSCSSQAEPAVSRGRALESS